MQDLRVAGIAGLLTGVAIVDTLTTTPEDAFPVLGWGDEILLWGTAARLWVSFAEGKTLETLFQY